MHKLKIITSTTRPGHKGIAIAEWFTSLSHGNSNFEAELLDLARINLPMMDEPHHPRLQQYEHEHTKAWSKLIDEADCYVVTLAEYNYGFPAPIKNALDYLYNEWNYKPMAFISYGGMSAGMRSLQMIKQVVTALHVMPLVESVSIPMFSGLIDKTGKFQPDEKITNAATLMLKELGKWSASMKQLREQKKEEKKNRG